MRFTLGPAAPAVDGIREQPFRLGDVPGVLWTPDGAAGPRPLVLLGHGGGGHKKAPDVVARARLLAGRRAFAVVSVDVPAHGERPAEAEYDRIVGENQARIAAGAQPYPLIAGFQALVARRTVPEWRAVIDALRDLPHVGAGPVGYWGVSLGCGLGVPFVAAEPRVRAAVLGLGGAQGFAEHAARITAPVRFLLQWDDERVPRAEGLALFDAFGSREKTLHANPGAHGELPEHEVPAAAGFLGRHLS
jgi:dienelactone hydrolase